VEATKQKEEKRKKPEEKEIMDARVIFCTGTLLPFGAKLRGHRKYPMFVMRELKFDFIGSPLFFFLKKLFDILLSPCSNLSLYW
jgi:hypothetical protein